MINAQAGNEAQEDRSKRFKIIVNARSKEVTAMTSRSNRSLLWPSTPSPPVRISFSPSLSGKARSKILKER